MPEWIKVSDELPPKYRTVFVDGGCAYYGHNDKWYSLIIERPIQWEVTHWMRIPRLPEDDNG